MSVGIMFAVGLATDWPPWSVSVAVRLWKVFFALDSMTTRKGPMLHPCINELGKTFNLMLKDRDIGYETLGLNVG